MTNIAVQDAIVMHTGSTAVGPVTSTITTGSNTFVYVENSLVIVEDAIITVPTHIYDLGPPPLSHSHTFPLNNLNQNFVYVENKKMVIVGDGYNTDTTTITDSGSNNFVEIN